MHETKTGACWIVLRAGNVKSEVDRDIFFKRHLLRDAKTSKNFALAFLLKTPAASAAPTSSKAVYALVRSVDVDDDDNDDNDNVNVDVDVDVHVDVNVDVDVDIDVDVDVDVGRASGYWDGPSIS